MGNKNVIIVGIIAFLLICSLGVNIFIIYDKYLKNENSNILEKNEINLEERKTNSKESEVNNYSIPIKSSEYFNYFLKPIESDEFILDYNDNEDYMANFIYFYFLRYENLFGEKDKYNYINENNISTWEIPKDIIDDVLYKYFNVKNITLNLDNQDYEMKIQLVNDKYVISAIATEYGIFSNEFESINYLDDEVQVIYNIKHRFISETSCGKKIITLKYIDDKFYIEKVENNIDNDVCK